MKRMMQLHWCNLLPCTVTSQTDCISSVCASILRKMGGRDPPRSWVDGSLPGVIYKLGEDSDIATVEVNNALVETKIHNVFGVIKGVTDPGACSPHLFVMSPISAIELNQLYCTEPQCWNIVSPS